MCMAALYATASTLVAPSSRSGNDDAKSKATAIMDRHSSQEGVSEAQHRAARVVSVSMLSPLMPRQAHAAQASIHIRCRA